MNRQYTHKEEDKRSLFFHEKLSFLAVMLILIGIAAELLL